MPKKKILFTFLKTGGGHIAPASAVSSYLEDTYSESTEIIMCDFFKSIGETALDNRFLKSWDSMLLHPNFNKHGHAFISHFPALVRLWEYMTLKRSIAAAIAYIEQEVPDIVVSTHGFTAFVLEYVKRKSSHPFSLVTMSTDPLSSHIFIELLNRQDYYIVSSEFSKQRLITGGCKEERIHMFPFPINRTFTREIDKERLESLRNEYGIDSVKKTLLVSFGGQGVGNITVFLDALIENNTAINVVVVCGRNEQQFQMLKKNYNFETSGNVNIVPLGFIDNMPEIVSLCDFSFIKPGVSTTFENLLKRKPIIFYESAAHIEDANIDFAKEHGIGIDVGNSVQKFVDAVTYYLKDNGLEIAQEKYQSLELHNGADQIGDFLMNL